jgi:serine O-acetyltransferase
MIVSLENTELTHYIVKQLNTFFPDSNRIQTKDISEYVAMTLEKMEYCFSKINNKYYRFNNEIFFNHLNSDHYAMFLYTLSRIILIEENNANICTKLFLLNKCLHSIDIYYDVILPDIFLFVHPVGTVLGRAEYSDYFMVYQKCNIGANKGQKPVIGKYVTLHPGSAILGNCHVGENCKIAAGSLLLDTNLEKDSVYIGNPRDYIIKKSSVRNKDWV